MKRKAICAVIASMLIVSSLTSCESKKGTQLANYMAENKDIQLTINQGVTNTEREELTWVELDQLTTHEKIRITIDDVLNIIKFNKGSKNGVLYIGEDNSWNPNNTLMSTFQNKEFRKTYWADNKIKGQIADAAIETFSDITNEDTGIIAAINAYYNILPANTDGTSGLMNYISRKDVMAAIYRADTPVRMVGSNEFDTLFGYDEYNGYAYNLRDCSWLTVDNGSLNAYTYYSSMTRAEALYMIVQRYFKDEYNNINELTTGQFIDCTPADDIFEKYEIEKGHSWQTYALENSLENPENGVPADLYKAIMIAHKHGIISNETNWNESIRYGELLNMLIKTYQALYTDSNYPINAKFGTNEGKEIETVEIPLITKHEISTPEGSEEPEELEELGEPEEADPIDKVLEDYADIITMTDEQIELLRKDSEGFEFDKVDTYLTVANCTWLNVRSGPGTQFSILKEVPAGTEVHIIAKCTENEWYRVIIDGVVSYQYGAYFS